MKTVGLFEAKTKLSGLCEEVSRTKLPLLLQRRGKPLVMISPVPAEISQNRPGIWDEWKAYEGTDEGEGDFPEVWKMRIDKKESPFSDRAF